MSKKINLIEAAMKYRQIIISFVVLFMGFGLYALQSMPRDEFPQFVIRQGVIVGVFPGATSQEVEQHATKVIENYIFGYKEVDKAKTYSHSKEGMLIIYVELNNDVTDPDRFWSKLRHGLRELKMQLPTELIALIGTNDFGDTSAMLVTMSSKTKTPRELEDIMEKLRDRIRKVPEVSKMKTLGAQREKIFIHVDEEKLNEYALSPTTIMTAFKVHDFMSYAGELDNGDLILPVHVPPKFSSEEDVLNLVVYTDPQGNVIRLKNIATVERRYEEPDSYIRNNGNPSMVLSLEMQFGNNIVEFGHKVNKVLDEFKDEMGESVDINIISNQPHVVNESITHFLKELSIAILSVVLVTMLLLPLRVAAVAAITIPITILITIGVMLLVGIQLDMVSLAGLIVVLGMVVDNAIVVIDNHVEKLDHGIPPWDAAWKAATELFVPVFAATAAILSSFLPMMFYMTGMAGDFVSFFPLTIGIALGFSLIIAMLLVPFLCYAFIKKGLHQADQNQKKPQKRSLLDIVQNIYDHLLTKCFRHPVLTLVTGFLIVVVGLGMFTKVPQRLFPGMERNQFAVEVTLPIGSSLDKTAEVIDSLEKILMKDERVTNVAAFVGSSSPRFHALYAPRMASPEIGQILVNTISNEATLEVIEDYQDRYTEFFPGAHVKWKRLAMEKFAAPIEIRLSGDSIPLLKETGARVKEIFKENPNITWIRDDWFEKRTGIRLDLDSYKTNELGYVKALIASNLMVSLGGLPVSTVWEDDYAVGVVLQKEKRLRDGIEDLKNQYVQSPITFKSLPLRSVGTLRPEWTEGVIVHRNGVRTLTIQADVNNLVTYSTVVSQLKPYIEKLDLPQGVELSWGGEKEETIENYVPMGYSMVTSIVLIYFILLFQFRGIKKALLVMSTMLLSIPGAVLGLLLVGYPFGLTTFIGIIGLMGITVRNGIILVDYALELQREHQLNIREAAISAGKRRMRPIFLTAMAAAVGVVPMIMSGSPLWGPLGTVICFGLIVGMIMTLFILPVMYWVSFAHLHKKSSATSSIETA